MSTPDFAAALRPLVEQVVREQLAELRKEAPPTLIDCREAARRAGVSMESIRRWCSRGRLTPHSAGRELRIDAAELERYLAQPPQQERR